MICWFRMRCGAGVVGIGADEIGWGAGGLGSCRGRHRGRRLDSRHAHRPTGHRKGARTDHGPGNTTHTPDPSPRRGRKQKLRTQFPCVFSTPNPNSGDPRRNESSSQPSRSVRQVQKSHGIRVRESLFRPFGRFLISPKLCVVFRLGLRQELHSEKHQSPRRG